MWSEGWSDMSEKSPPKEKQHRAKEEWKLCIDPEEMKFKEPMENARGKLGLYLDSAVPSKWRLTSWTHP